MSNFVEYSQANSIITKIAQKFNALGGAYIFRGSSAFASIPATPTAAEVGYVWNITDAFTTDARFVEGAGKDYPEGSNIAVADLSTFAAAVPVSDPAAEGLYELNAAGKYVPTADTQVEAGKTYYAKTEVIKYDVLAGFIDVDEIMDRIDAIAADIADEFDATQAYAIDDVVVYEDGLYIFTAAHTATDPWDPTEVTAVTIESLISAAEPDALTTAQLNALLALLD